MPYFDRIFECNTGQFIGVIYHPNGTIYALLDKDINNTGLTGTGTLNKFCELLNVKIVRERSDFKS